MAVRLPVDLCTMVVILNLMVFPARKPDWNKVNRWMDFKAFLHKTAIKFGFFNYSFYFCSGFY